MTNFFPCETVSLNAGTSSSQVSFALPLSIAYPDVLITNSGAQIAFVGFGIVSATAYAPGAGIQNATPILPGETMVLRKGQSAAAMAAITLSGTTQLYFTAGQGQ